jgi:hypothetical protein
LGALAFNRRGGFKACLRNIGPKEAERSQRHQPRAGGGGGGGRHLARSGGTQCHNGGGSNVTVVVAMAIGAGLGGELFLK